MNPIVAIQKSITAQANRATRLPSPVAQFRTFLRLNDKVAGNPAEVQQPSPPAEGELDTHRASEVADEGHGSAYSEYSEGKQCAPAKKRRRR